MKNVIQFLLHDKKNTQKTTIHNVLNNVIFKNINNAKKLN